MNKTWQPHVQRKNFYSALYCSDIKNVLQRDLKKKPNRSRDITCI
jgi:hypothetical protein